MVEPPSKPAGGTDDPNIQEEEGKGKELAAAAADSAKFQVQKAKAKKAAADKAAADAAVAQKKKIDAENKALTMPDGNIHKNGQKYFVDGAGVVAGVNNYA